MNQRNTIFTAIIASLLAIAFNLASIHISKDQLLSLTENLLSVAGSSSLVAQVQGIDLDAQRAGVSPNANPDAVGTEGGAELAWYDVVRVVDGDTIVVVDSNSVDPENGNRKDDRKDHATIRLIGLNTPESVDPRKPVECFAAEASEFLKETLSGGRVRLEFDPSQDSKDRYGRHLAYVYSEDGLFINLHMIEEGYGHEYTHDKPYAYQASFKQAEAYAKYHSNGLWDSSACGKI